MSTCPHLYAWDGARFALVSDFAGVGGLGYWLAPGVYAVPRPREYVPIGRLEPQDGQRPELYDYERVDRSVPWNLMTGAFTRYGDVRELLHETDDCYVIMGRGDELTLRFPADAFGPVAHGYRRSFVLKADAYSKDMSLYTAFADTVEPLPFHAMRDYPYGADEAYPDTDQTRDYRTRFNTRRVD